MALSQAAKKVEDFLGHTGDGTTAQNVSNYGNNPAWADPSGEKMKALAWFGKNHVEVVETPKPNIIEPTDIIVKVTGSTICGSDLHLTHGKAVI